VELLGEVGLDRVEPRRRRRGTGEHQQVLGGDDLDLAEHRVAEGHVHAKGLAVDLALEPTLGLMAMAVVRHAAPAMIRTTLDTLM
jgi:hypothetical protein